MKNIFSIILAVCVALPLVACSTSKVGNDESSYVLSGTYAVTDEVVSALVVGGKNIVEFSFSGNTLTVVTADGEKSETGYEVKGGKMTFDGHSLSFAKDGSAIIIDGVSFGKKSQSAVDIPPLTASNSPTDQTNNGTEVGETNPTEQSTMGRLIFSPFIYAIKNDGVCNWGPGGELNLFPEQIDLSMNSEDILSPAQVATDLLVIKQIASGRSGYALLLSENGDLYVYNPYAAFDFESQTMVHPVTIERMEGIGKIASLPFFANERYGDESKGVNYAIAENGDLYSIEIGVERVESPIGGDGAQAAPGMSVTGLIVDLVKDAPKVKKVANSGGTSIFLTPNGEVYTRGSNEDGKLGDGSDVSYSADFIRVAGLSNIVDIEGDGYDNGYALTADGRVYAWGNNYRGQLGAGGMGLGESNVPVDTGLFDIKAIYCSRPYENSEAPLLVAVSNSGAVYAPPIWDENKYGYGYAQVPGVSNAKDIAIFDDENLFALTDDGSIYAFEDYRRENNYGLLGIGNSTAGKHQSKVEGLPPITAIYAAFGGVFAVAEDGVVYAWGKNDMGQLGIGKSKEDYPSHISEYGYTVYDAYEPLPVKIDGLSLLNN